MNFCSKMNKHNTNEYQLNIKMEEDVLTTHSSTSKFCLICCSTITSPPCHQSSNNLLAKQLNIVFILRNLLQVPVENLEKYLKDFGNPDKWSIYLCDQCTFLANKTIKLNYQLAVVNKQIREIQSQVLDKIRNSLTEKENDTKNHENVNTIFWETRSLVKYNHKNASGDKSKLFLEGDRLADQNYQKNKQLLMDDPLPKPVKEEPVNQFEDDDQGNHTDHEDDWLPNSPSPPPTPPSSPPISKPKKVSRSRAPRRSRAKSKIDPTRKIRTFPLDKFICNLCPDNQKATFRYASKLKAHLKDNHDTETVTCPEAKCKGLSFDKLSDYLTHRQKIHLFKEPKKCEICAKTFKCLPAYYSHRKIKHANKDTIGNGKDWICDHCGKELGSINSLRTHLKYKHKRDIDGKELTVQKHVCDVCGLALKSLEGLKAHYRSVHERVNTATCHLCGKELKNKFNLKQHLIRRHKEEAMEELEGMKVGGKGSELWRCRVPGCPRYYFEKGKLEEHRLEKHGLKGEGEGGLVDRPFKCEKCGQGFWMRNKLRDHEKVHEREGKTDWRCGECGKGFGFKKYMRDHMVRMHKISREELDRRENESKK